jgi:hypothetical protein
MSYDICFWREQPGAKVDAKAVIRELVDTVEFPGVVGMPLESVQQAFKREFSDLTGGGIGLPIGQYAEPLHQSRSLDWEGDGSYFQAHFTFLDARTVSRISVCCGYNLLKSPQAMKKLENVAMSLGCRFYDLQQ